MAFLFKSKKHQQATTPPTKDVPVSAFPNPGSSIPGANGSPAAIRDRDREAARNLSPTPNSSINNSLNSAGANINSSPDQKLPRERTEQDIQGPRTTPSSNSLSTSPNASLYPWSQRRFTYTTPHPSPFPRYGAAVNSVATKEGEIYLMGGLINTSTVKGDLWMVEAGQGNLTCYPLPTTSEGPGPRVQHASLIVGNAFIVYGGDTKIDDRDVLDDNLYLLNTSTRHWSRAVPAGPRPSGRYGHTLNIIGSKIYIFGGQVEGVFFNDLVAFDLNALQKPNNRWEMLIQNSIDGGPPPGQIPPARTNHTVVTWNEKLYLFGGTNGYQWFNDVWTYDPRTNLWSQLDCIGYIPVPRDNHAATLVGDVMYIFGGRTEDSTDLGDLAALRISSRRWYTFQKMGPSPSPRSGHSMTSFGKQIVVLGGEPSSVPRDPAELSLVYVLDTSKIRYPNDQTAPPQQGSAERMQGNRRPSGGEKSGIPQSRIPASRDGSVQPLEGRDPKRIMGAPRESVVGGTNPFNKGAEMHAVNGASATSGPSPGSRLPRISQAPSGPPPQQPAPTPRPNGVLPTPPGPRSKTPTRSERMERSERNAYAVHESERGPSLEKENVTPGIRESPSSRDGGTPNGRRTPTSQQQNKASMKPRDAGEVPDASHRERSRSRQTRQKDSFDSTQEISTGKNTNGFVTPMEEPAAPVDTMQGAPSTEPVLQNAPPQSTQRNVSHGTEGTSTAQQPNESLQKELEAVKSRNAWYASEVALARKAGYVPSTSNTPQFDDSAADMYGDDDRPLIEALMAMRAELARVQGAIDAQASATAKQVADVERQRDVAVSEAVYAKAKLAAHGGSQAGTPQPDGISREVSSMDHDRSAVLNRKLATSLELQAQLQSKLTALHEHLNAERQARQLADDNADASQKRVAELEAYKQKSAPESEGLRAELCETQMLARDESARRAEAEARVNLLQVDKDDLERRLVEAIGQSRDHTSTLSALRDAVEATTDRSTILERKLEEERTHRDTLERKLRQLRAEHEERTAELETTSRRLRDAEELAEAHATEARTHRQTMLSGLETVSNRDFKVLNSQAVDERCSTLQQQLDASQQLVRKTQAAADAASERLRSAEERIAGLEAYQEQVSREGLTIRKQLQSVNSHAQTLQAENADVKQQLAKHKLQANAVAVEHGALKDLLGERGLHGGGRENGSPASGFGTPDLTRLRELEHQLDESQKAQEDMESSFEQREQEADRAYREKLEQLENDYQSAVHYVKGTEKMLEKMKKELSRYRTANTRLQTELEEVQKVRSPKGVDPEMPAEWDRERKSLRSEVEELQNRLQTSTTQVQEQMEVIRGDLRVAREQRDLYQNNNEHFQRQMAGLTQRAHADLEQLKTENAQLESRALDAEQKVSLLLDQVESSVDTYRRQSRQSALVEGGPGEVNGLTFQPSQASSHHRRASSTSAATESNYSPSGRNSDALDHLASELETLRSQWANTNKNYRLSNTFEFERTPTNTSEGGLGGWSKKWRDGLDLESGEEDERKDRDGSGRGGRIRTPEGQSKERTGGNGEKEIDLESGEDTPTKAEYARITTATEDDGRREDGQYDSKGRRGVTNQPTDNVI
ncbi:MAG: Negative regulator of mitotic exit [Caeruleum heppii]|nr:MAG: Negative regulator of mitotic exit [Caeruleum heppii]